MSQYSLSLDTDIQNAGALLVRDARGAVRPARRKEILRVVRRLIDAGELRGQALDNPERVKGFLRLRFNAALEHEVFGLILLNNAHELIAYLEPFRGTIDQAAVYPREVVKIALMHNARSLILVHNHPSGNPAPSAADIALTKHLRQALMLIDVQVLDHFIVAGAQVASMAERGLI